MATYVVGDIQGCYDPLAKLLDKVNFDQSRDMLVCVGDLVNRGDRSLKVLRFLKSLENQCLTVLGNHDIHLLSLLYGVRLARPSDTLVEILEAPDVGELAEWLRSQPLMLQLEKQKVIICHAGIYPWWSGSQAQGFSDEMSEVFANEKSCITLLRNVYGDLPNKWHDGFGKTRRHRFIINAFTRMRFCSPDGHLNLTESGYSGKSRKNRVPWFTVDNKRLNHYRIIFGHWSALGLLNTEKHLCLDTGCVWGRHLTMAKLPSKPTGERIKESSLLIASNH